MDVKIQPGSYVVAVSGGVDSMVLLDALLGKKNVKLIVAHANHGIRGDADQDELLARDIAEKNNLIFETRKLKLGPHVSEDKARRARYNFLREVKEKHQADSIITAHHQDDVIETMMLNVLRGTGRKGLSSLKSTAKCMRPFIEFSKHDIRQYAEAHKLTWREDSTNQDDTYARNYLRKHVVSKLSTKERQKWIEIYTNALRTNTLIDQEITTLLQSNDAIIRSWLLQFPNVIACELVAEILRQNGTEISRRQVQDTVVFCKTGKVGAQKLVSKDVAATAAKKAVTIEHRTSTGKLAS